MLRIEPEATSVKSMIDYVYLTKRLLQWHHTVFVNMKGALDPVFKTSENHANNLTPSIVSLCTHHGYSSAR